jgi:cell pole-organizing protein PopZ
VELTAVASDPDDQEIELAPLEDELPEEDPISAIGAYTSQEEEPAVSTKKAETEALLSTGTASTTTGAFAKLSKAFRPTPVEESVADGSGRTVEQFIEDMARPMLKEWLDENMPAIVERLVQKEIQKIARRAELL